MYSERGAHVDGRRQHREDEHGVAEDWSQQPGNVRGRVNPMEDGREQPQLGPRDNLSMASRRTGVSSLAKSAFAFERRTGVSSLN